MASFVTKNSQISNESTLKRKESFLTQNSVPNTPYQQIQVLYSQIHSLINKMDNKIEEVINRHQSEFLIAFRHHSQKIRAQLQSIKKRAQNVQNSSNYQDKINSLEKQITIFREQSLVLYQKLEAKNQQCQLYKHQLKDVKEHNRFLEDQVKKTLRKTKFMEIKYIENQTSKQKQKQQKSIIIPRYVQNQQSPKGKILTNHNFFHSTQKTKNSRISTVPKLNIRRMKYITKPQLKDFKKLDPLSGLESIVNDQSIMTKIRETLNFIIEQKDKKYINLMKKYQDTLKLLKFSDKNELQQLFLNCVESVRKDICKKQQSKPEQISIEKIKPRDQIAILQRFVENNQNKNIYQSEMFSNKQLYKKYNSFVN